MQTLIDNTADALEQTELGKILECIEDVQMALDCYIDDFIQIVYTVKTESELQVTIYAGCCTKHTNKLANQKIAEFCDSTNLHNS